MFADTTGARGYFLKPQSQGEVLKDIKTNVKTYMDTYGQQGLQIDIFRNLMTQQIKKQDRQIDEAPSYQIYRFFPWIFNSELIPYGFKIILFFQFQNVGLDKANQVNFQSIDKALVEQTIQKAVYLSKKFNAPYLQSALSKYADYLKYKDDDSIGFIRNVKTLWGKTWNKLVGGNMSNQMIRKMFNSIKPYGKLLINMEYLQKYAEKQQTLSGIVFSLATVPSIRFVLNKAIIQVQVNSQGQFVKLQEEQFNQNFIKSLIRQRTHLAGSYMIKNFNQQLTSSKQVMTNKSKFIKQTIKGSKQSKHKIKKFRK